MAVDISTNKRYYVSNDGFSMLKQQYNKREMMNTSKNGYS